MIETRDLILDKGKLEDWEAMYKNIWSHDESAQHMLWRPVHTEEDAQERMKKNIAFMEKCELAWFIYEKTSGEAIGFAGMEQIGEGVYEDTGIAIGPAFTRKGYGKQILMALVNEAFINLGADKFVCSCRSQNEASKQLQISCGFVYSHSENKIDPRDGKEYILDYYEQRK